MGKDVMQLTSRPLSEVHVGMVGLGRRGIRALKRLSKLDGVSICAVADYRPESAAEAAALLPEDNCCALFSGERAWVDLCSLDYLDLIYICTDWSSHVAISLAAMDAGKHVAVEVPAATSLEDCFRLVKKAEETRKHCVMLENCCYDPFALTTVRLAEMGRLGDIVHAEGGYIHDLLRRELDPASSHSYKDWEADSYLSNIGNPYPTHGLGPICLTMNIHRGDCMERLVSLSSSSMTPGNARINTSVIRTHLGRTIVISHDVSTPRPYSREMITCGTKGFTRKYPAKCIMFDGDTEQDAYAKTEEREQQYAHPVTTYWGKKARQMNGDNEMNYVMDMRLIHCLREGLPMDIDIYDAAEWSAVIELSKMSVEQGGAPVMFPDFTDGLWKTAAPHRFYE